MFKHLWNWFLKIIGKKKHVFLDSFILQLKAKGLPKSSLKKLKDKIKNINANVNHPKDPFGKNILLVGNIQSGKTNSFLGLISRAFDHEKINLAFVISGVDNEIFKQTYERIVDVFSSEQIKDRVAIFKEDALKKVKEQQRLTQALENNKKVIIVSIKNYVTINKWHAQLKARHSKIKGVIIVDDEGDQFSQNNIKKASDGAKSATHEAICKLIRLLKSKMNFFSVTATPYAHIMLEKNDALKPDYAFLIDKGIGYTSLDYFIDQENENRSNYSKLISDDEINNFTKNKELGSAFSDAILTYLVHSLLFSDWAKDNSDIADKHGVMLINPDRRNEIQEIVKVLVIKELNVIYTRILRREQPILKQIWDLIHEYNLYAKKYRRQIVYYNIEIFIDKLIYEFQKQNIQITLVNRNNELKKASKQFVFYIGCNKLSRGVTLPSLITTFHFIKKGGGNLDTISQTARWLGYRQSYSFFLTIYLSKNLYSAFSTIKFMNSELYHILEDYETRKQSIKDLDRKLYIKSDNQVVRATRTTVSKQEVKNAEIEDIEKLISSRNFFIDYNYIDNWETKVISNSLKHIAKEILKNHDGKDLNSLSWTKKLKNVPFLVLKNIDEFEKLIDSNTFNKMSQVLGMSNNLFQGIIKKNKNKKIILALMQNKDKKDIKHRWRVLDKKRISEIPSGNSEDYVGDRYWLDDLKSKNYLIFQIYPIMLDNKIELFRMGLIQYIGKNSNDDGEILIIEGVNNS